MISGYAPGSIYRTPRTSELLIPSHLRSRKFARGFTGGMLANLLTENDFPGHLSRPLYLSSPVAPSQAGGVDTPWMEFC